MEEESEKLIGRKSSDIPSIIVQDSDAPVGRRPSDVPEILVQMHGGVVPEIVVDFDPDNVHYNGFLSQPLKRSSSMASLHGLMNQTAKSLSNTMSNALETSGVQNVMPSSKQLEFLMEPANRGATKVRNKLSGTDSTLSKTSKQFNELPKEWRRVFVKLDRRDGKGDDRIKKADFFKWIAELDEDSAFNLGNNKEITKPKLQSWISNIDEDKDAYISQEEWVILVGLMEEEEEPEEIEHIKINIETQDGQEMCPLTAPLACFDEVDDNPPSKSNTLRKMSAMYTKDGLDYCCIDEADQMKKEEQLEMRENVRSIMGRKRMRAKLRQYTINAAHSRQLRWWPPPIFTISISIIQLSMYGYHVNHLINVHNDELSWNGPTPFCSTLIYDPERRFEVVRYVTYSLVHVGAEHITFNLVMQLAIGIPLEMFNSFWRVSIVYLAGVLAGSVATSTLDPQMFLAGASGGVYALITAHLSSLILNWKEDRLVLTQQIMHARQNTPVHGDLLRLVKLVAVVFFAVVDTGLAIYTKHNTPEASSTGYIAHLAGAMAGLTVGILVLKNRKKEAWESWLRLGCIILFSVLMTSGIVWNVVARDVLAKYNMTDSDWDFFPGEVNQTECHLWEVDVYNSTCEDYGDYNSTCEDYGDYNSTYEDYGDDRADQTILGEL